MIKSCRANMSNIDSADRGSAGPSLAPTFETQSQTSPFQPASQHPRTSTDAGDISVSQQIYPTLPLAMQHLKVKF